MPSKDIFELRVLPILFALTIIVYVIDINVLLNAFVTFFWVLYMVKSSKFDQTIYGRISCILLAITLLGLLFKLQHWPGSFLLLTIGIGGTVITYVIRFFNKQKHQVLDVLKLLFVVNLGTLAYGDSNRYFGEDTHIFFQWINFSITLLLFGWFTLQQVNKNKRPQA